MRVPMMILLGAVATPPALSHAQSMEKKTQSFVVSRDMPHAPEDVWAVVAQDYGRIAETHPTIVASEYAPGSLVGELGAERFCYFNERHTRSLKEKIVAFDEQNLTFDNRVLEAAGFPIDPDNTLGTYTVTPLDDGGSRLTFEMEYRTKPAMMGALAKGGFVNLMEGYMVAVDHHLRTGEAVNRDNFKQIAQRY